MINYCTLIENDLSLVLSELGTQDLKRNARRSFQATHVPAAMLPSVQPRHFGDRRVRAVDLGRLLTTNYAPFPSNPTRPPCLRPATRASLATSGSP